MCVPWTVSAQWKVLFSSFLSLTIFEKQTQIRTNKKTVHLHVLDSQPLVEADALVISVLRCMKHPPNHTNFVSTPEFFFACKRFQISKTHLTAKKILSRVFLTELE